MNINDNKFIQYLIKEIDDINDEVISNNREGAIAKLITIENLLETMKE